MRMTCSVIEASTLSSQYRDHKYSMHSPTPRETYISPDDPDVLLITSALSVGPALTNS